MRRRSPVPALVLAALTVLAVGAAVLGLVQAPPTPDLTVHNGAGEIGYASSLTYLESVSTNSREVIRVTFQAPDRITETVLLDGRRVRSTTVASPSARTRALAPFTFVGRLSRFSARDSSFVATRPVKSLFPASERSRVSGTVTYSARVSGGYLVAVVVHYRYTAPGGSSTGSERVRVTSINGQPAPAP